MKEVKKYLKQFVNRWINFSTFRSPTADLRRILSIKTNDFIFIDFSLCLAYSRFRFQMMKWWYQHWCRNVSRLHFVFRSSPEMKFKMVAFTRLNYCPGHHCCSRETLRGVLLVFQNGFSRDRPHPPSILSSTEDCWWKAPVFAFPVGPSF